MRSVSGTSYAEYLAAVVAGVEKHPLHVITHGDTYTRVLRVSTWPERPVVPGFLERFYVIQLPQNVTVELVYKYRKAVLDWGWKANWKYNRLARKVATEQTPDPAEMKALEAMQRLKEEALYGGADTVDVWLYIVVRSIGDPGTLDSVCRRIVNDFRDLGMLVSPLVYEQPQAYRETFILGRTEAAFQKAYPGRIVQADAVAALYPCLAGSVNDGTGVYVGHSVSTRTANFINLKRGVENQNMCVLGASGEGKSVFQKTLVQGMRLENMLVIVFDMNGEYRKVTEKTGGLYIDHTLGTGKYIDPLAIPAKTGIPEYDAARLTSVADALLTTISILAEGITPGERNAADRALMALYREVRIDLDKPETWDFTEQPFDMEDWWNALIRDKSPDAASLRDKLAIYFTGSKRNLFRQAEHVEVPEDCSLIVFQVAQSIEGADAQIGAAKMAMTLTFVRDLLRREKLKGQRYTAVIFDEAQRLLLNPEASAFINSLATMIRHLNGMIVVATNKPHVFWAHGQAGAESGGTGIWANSKYKIFFWLENSEIVAIEQNAEIPKEITDMLKTMHLSQQFLIRHLDRGWDRCQIFLPPEEIALYKTRGIADE
ncbi:MAG: DUF87 domain-containing protein [Armatimonadetes bacterium]|nr:DUF87 domain-containing protein [Armatimonadota bacterium]